MPPARSSPAPTDADQQHVLATWALVEANLIGVGPPSARVTLRALEHLLDLRDPQGLWEGSRGGPALTGSALHVLGLAGFSDRLSQEAVRSWLDVPGAGSASTLRLLHRALRGADTRQAIFAEDEPARAKAGLQIRLSDLFILTADVVAVAVLAGLTIWFYHGGAHRLAIWWGSLTTLVS